MQKSKDIKSYWSRIEAKYIDESDIMNIHAWETEDSNEEGKDIARIEFGKHHIEYLDSRAKEDIYAQEIIIRSLCGFCSGNDIEWIIHYVFDCDDRPYGIDIHTHGMKRYDGHPDFQIVLPISQKLSTSLLNTLGITVRYGYRYDEGIYHNLIMNGFDIMMARVRTFNNEEVLRCIIPDSNNLFYDSDQCDENYRKQGSDISKSPVS